MTLPIRPTPVELRVNGVTHALTLDARGTLLDGEEPPFDLDAT